MQPTTVEVEEERAGERLDRFLAERLGISRARVRHLLEFGRVSSAGRTLELSDKSRPVAGGEGFVVAGSLRAEEESPIARPDLDWRLVAEGEGWLVVDKPVGRGVHPLHPDQDDTVLNAVIARREQLLGVGEGGLRSGVVHRLDVDTSGVLVFATDEACWKRLRGAFSAHRVKKRYLALVAGRFEAPRFVELPLAVKRHRPARVEVVAASEGRLCRQRVRPLRVFENATLVEVDLETGFLHQVRALMAHLGHPVLGDAEYGGTAGDLPISAPRPLLHAERLTVDEIDVSVEPPADFEAAIAELSAPAGG